MRHPISWAILSACATGVVAWSIWLDLSTVVPGLGSQSSAEAAAAISIGMQAGFALAIAFWASIILPDLMLWRTEGYGPADEDSVHPLAEILAVTGLASALVPLFPAVAWQLQQALPGSRPPTGDAHMLGAKLLAPEDLGDARTWLASTAAVSTVCLASFCIHALVKAAGRRTPPFAGTARASGQAVETGSDEDLASCAGDHLPKAEA